MTRSALLALAFAAASRAAAASEDPIEIRPGTTVAFASAAAGARVLSSRDVFVRAMSPFDRSARLKTDRDVTEPEYLAFAARQAQDWNEGEKARLRTILESFKAKTAQLDLRLPPSISLLKTTGLEEGMASYCRGSSIVIPGKLLEGPPDQLESLVFHELFHVYRAHDPASRRAFYKIIGFEVCPEIVLPEDLRARKITNPDAPLLDAFIRVKVGGKLVAAAPVLLSRTPRYDTKAGGEFFDSMVFQLLILEEGNGGFRPARLPGGGPDLRDPSSVPDYVSQIGRNTEYVIHPEEILADNFVLMVKATAPVPTPRIPREMRSLLTKPGAGPKG
jgi:hypothetical protein